MELQKAIESRRSIRRYGPDRPVEEEKIRALLESARLCQSAHNRQPWRFMVLKGEKKDQIAGLLARQAGCYKIMLLTGSKRESTLSFYRHTGYRDGLKTGFCQKLDG